MTKLAATHLRLPAQRTMELAEALYTKGLIAYPRTETDTFPETMNIPSLISQLTRQSDWGTYARSLITDGKYSPPRSGSRSDAAHPPIYPVKSASRSEFESEDHWRLYELIFRQFLATCSNDAIGMRTNLEVEVIRERFTATALKVEQANFLEIWEKYEPWRGSTALPNLQPGTELPLKSLALRDGTTTSPSLLSETELITLMDRHGVGTDATMHEHIKTIETREYVQRIVRSASHIFKPTILGLALYQGYKRSSSGELTAPSVRAQLENDLKEIVQGHKTRSQVVDENIEKYQRLFNVVAANMLAMERSLSLHFQPKN